MKKRIITCSDGTWNSPYGIFHGKPIRTNVQKIFEAICNRDDKDDIAQIKYYDTGVGTTGNRFERIYAGMVGYGLDENILDAYKFIVWNYEQGDELYLFGFSRGAYTARSLCGMIYKCGILRNNDLNLIQQAYRLYRDDALKAGSPEAQDFRDANSHPARNIYFIGVWDTVGSLGIPGKMFDLYNKKKYEFHDTKLNHEVAYAYHALAVDERRVDFEPALWEQSEKAIGAGRQVMEQMWFPGVHSNVGGGYESEKLSDIALQWMVEKAAGTGLAFEQAYVNGRIEPDADGMLYNSKVFPFSLKADFLRPVAQQKNGNEQVHPSVYTRMEQNAEYRPPNIGAAKEK
ncbi:MAG: DUF2235 domain-containing protein [Mucilaginibacter polytrichastri]|nr:DUF2235 domain-containing protein [Mucilaginibacter polytrichastri]